MLERIKYEFEYDDYAQSANTLFHFMKKPKFLKDSLQMKALVPRYCKENVEYLNIHNGENQFKEILILQKCFCDIPIHKLMNSFHVKDIGENFGQLSEEKRRHLSDKYTHPDFYGEYGIAFSKSWGERKNLQPIHYLNESSAYTRETSNLIGTVMVMDNVPDIYVKDILNRLAFIKPLRGIMKRKVDCSDEEMEIEFYKNFHDEQEWRYVPNSDACYKIKLDYIIANKKLIKLHDNGMDLNVNLADERYRTLWLEYEYEDIRYIIVPDANARMDIIQSIMNIPEDKFNVEYDVSVQRQVLISKILVLEEIGKDW